MVNDLTKERKIFLVIFVLSFAFDFKGKAGGSIAQYVMAAINLLTFLGLALSYQRLPRRSLAAIVIWTWLLFLAVGTSAALLNSVPLNQFVRIFYQYFLFVEGVLVAWWAARSQRGADLIVQVMTIAAVISLIFTFWWGFHFTGQGLTRIRYQILSPLIPFLIVVAGYDLFFIRRRKVRSIILLLILLEVIGLSVTRGMLLVFGLVLFVLFAAWLGNTLAGTNTIPRPLAKITSWGSASLLLGSLIGLLIVPEVLARWIHRGLGAGHDITFWTRIAAVVGQWQQMNAKLWRMTLGLGFGHSYHYAASIGEYMGKYAVLLHPARTMWYPGEFMWMTFLYYSGLVMGTLVISVLCLTVLRVFRACLEGLRSTTWVCHDKRSEWVGLLGYIAFLGLGFTANPFIIRLPSLFMGLCLGLFLARCRLPRPQFFNPHAFDDQRRVHE